MPFRSESLFAMAGASQAWQPLKAVSSLHARPQPSRNL